MVAILGTLCDTLNLLSGRKKSAYLDLICSRHSLKIKYARGRFLSIWMFALNLNMAGYLFWLTLKLIFCILNSFVFLFSARTTSSDGGELFALVQIWQPPGFQCGVYEGENEINHWKIQNNIILFYFSCGISMTQTKVARSKPMSSR